MDYQISHINPKDRWIFISSTSDFYTPDAFIHLLKSAVSYHGSSITEVGYCQYHISNLNFELIFQWDDLFGIVVIYPENSNLEHIISFINQLIDYARKQ